MIAMAHECYVVAAADDGEVILSGDAGTAKPMSVLRVFSSRELADRRMPDRGCGAIAAARDVDQGELRSILSRARDEGYTHVEVDGRLMQIDRFRMFLEHERLE